MVDDMMRDEYDVYLTTHISNVKKGFEWLLQKLPQLFKDYDADHIGSIIAQHDESKYSDEEYWPYCEYFYGQRNSNVEEEFNKAWLHHQHENPHHWQHWLLQEDEGKLTPLEMPYEYIIEMICDWWAFSWAKNDLYEIFNWYNNNKSKMNLHKSTLDTVENLLKLLKDTLDEETRDDKE